MEAQVPAQGILLHKDFGASKFYKVTCDCGNPDDELNFEVEADDSGVTVHTWARVKTDWWTTETKYGLLNGLWKRIKNTYKLWVNGYLDHEAWIVMDRQQALNYSWILNKAISDVEQFRKEAKREP